MNQSHFYLAVEKNIKLFAQIWAPNNTPKAIVLLVHGFGEHSQRYRHVAEAFAKNAIATLAIDLRGHGQTTGPRGYTNSYDAEIFPDLNRILDIVEEKFPNIPQFLYGHSTGGGIVLGYALKKKPDVAGVVATSPWITLTEEPPGPLISTMNMMKRVRPSFSNDMGYTEGLLSRDPQIDVENQADELMHGIMTAGLFIEAVENGRFVLNHANQFPLPLLLTHGTADKLTSFESSQQFATNAPADKVTLKLWPDAYHELHNDIIKDEVIEYITEWILGRV